VKSRSALAILFVIVFIDLLGFGMVVPLIQLYARDLDAPVAHVGLVSTGYSAMQLVFAPLWGRLSDRVGRRPVLLASIAMTAVAFVLTGTARSFAWLLGARLFAGAATANIAIAQAYVADVTTPENRARGMGAIGAAFGLGFVFGPFIGGVPSTFGLGVPFLAAGGLAAVNGLVALAILPEPQVHRSAAVRGRFAAISDAMRRPDVRRLLLAYLVSVAAFSAFENTFAMLAYDRFGFSTRQVGWVFALIGLLMAIVQGWMIGPLTARFGERRLWRAGMALQGLALAVFPFAGATGLVAACVPLAVGSGISGPAIASLFSRASAQEHQGSALGVAQSTSAMGRIVGPETGTIAYHFAQSAPFVAGAAALVLAGVIGSRPPRQGAAGVDAGDGTGYRSIDA
jgi:MFS family permease